jgi:hypothetical protein
MDGAQFAAWSESANMANYRVEDFDWERLVTMPVLMTLVITKVALPRCYIGKLHLYQSHLSL